jgi:uncharacterized membrane protein YhaH (DUF805 family)
MDWKYLFLSLEGRINRAKFWAGVGVIILGSIIFAILDAVLGTQVGEGVGILGLIYSVAMIYPAICLYAKRWHDRNKSGWWTLIVLIPLIGAIWLLVELGILTGTPGENRFGPDPLGQA